MRPINILKGSAIATAIWLLLATLFHTVFSWEDSLFASAATLGCFGLLIFIATYVFLFLSAMSDERKYRKGKYDR